MYVLYICYLKSRCACGIGHILKWVITLHVKILNVGKTGFDCHWRVVFLYYQTSYIKRLNNIVKVVLVYSLVWFKLINGIYQNVCPMNIYEFAVCVFKVDGVPILQWPGFVHPCTIKDVVYVMRRYILFVYNIQVSIVLMFYLFNLTLCVYSVL